MNRPMLALIAFALVALISKAAYRQAASEAVDDETLLRSAVLQPADRVPLRPVWWGYGTYGGWDDIGPCYDSLNYGALGYGAWPGGWEGDWWPNAGLSQPPPWSFGPRGYGEYRRYPYHTYSWYPWSNGAYRY